MGLLNQGIIQENQTDRLEIVYYTDPLCCWSWAFEPQWRRLLYEFHELINWRYRMGGLIPDWKSFKDPMNSIHRPAQMGPLWMETKYISGMPIDDTIWMGDAPVSSYPACIAVKAAEIQSKLSGEKMLRVLREAVMMNKKNVADKNVLLDLARAFSEANPGFLDFPRFKQDFFGEEARKAFSGDLQLIRINKITRFPTLTISNPAISDPNKRAIILTGFRPYPVLLQAIKNVYPELPEKRPPIDQDNYVSYWGDNLTEREIAEIEELKVESSS